MFELQLNGCSIEHIEALSELLENSGALSITFMDQLDQPILEPAPGETPLWQQVIIRALFAEKYEIMPVVTLITACYSNISMTEHQVPEQDWERVCMDDFKPQRFGERLWICPTWHTLPEPDQVNLILDPGLAFGTGNHATTALCLTWLERINLKNCTMIDYGCGSGILALAALKLGAQRVYAVDIDAQALTATQSNAALNQITSDQLILKTPDELDIPADIIVANILLTPLLALKTRFHELLKPEGLLIVSGVLATQVGTLIQEYTDLFIHQETQIKEDWALMVFSSTASGVSVPK